MDCLIAGLGWRTKWFFGGIQNQGTGKANHFKTK